MADANSDSSEALPVTNDNSDWFLQDMVGLVNRTDIKIGVTLTIGGSVISGMLLSGRSYFQKMGELMANPKESDESVANILSVRWSTGVTVYDKPDDAPDDWEAPLANYIHMIDASYFTPGQGPMPSKQGMLWRGRISAVDGFSIGNFTQD